LKLSLVGFALGNPNRFSVDADPAISSSFSASLARFLFRSVPLPTDSLAHFNGCLANLSVFAAPNEVLVRTISPRFFFRRVTLKLSLAGFARGNPNGFSVKADPALPAILVCFFLGSVILAALVPTFLRRTREDLSIETAPASWYTTVLGCFFWGIVTLTTSALAIGLIGLDEFSSLFSLQAAPTRFAMCARFFR